ncbi:MAG: MASE1 domain-containing protein, partial [Candidatus Acidiferrales bacterium]
MAAVYFVAGKLGLSMAFVHPSSTAVWPATGIALTAFLILGYRVWPGIFIGAFLVNITTAGSVLTSLGVATGNTLEGLLGAYLVLRFANGRRAFD